MYFDIADPSSMRDACHHELSKYDLAHHESPSSSVVRASDRCYGRSWVQFLSGTQTFSLSHARDMLNIPSFLVYVLFSESTCASVMLSVVGL